MILRSPSCGLASAAEPGFAVAMALRVFLASLSLAVGGASALAAQDVMPCDWRARADAIVEPWDTYSRTYAEGAVRVALLDTVEPAAAAFHLLILSPPFDELGARSCQVVSHSGSLGFAMLGFTEMEAGYDPARGLTLTIPGHLNAPDSGQVSTFDLVVTINQATGQITAETGPGRD